MIDYKKKYLKYKKKYLESKKIFHGGADPRTLPSILTVATGTQMAPHPGMKVLATTILDDIKLRNVPLKGQPADRSEDMSLRNIADMVGLFDYADIGMDLLENLKEEIARKLTNFPVTPAVANQLCREHHGVPADEAWAMDAFLQPGDPGQPADITERIKLWLNQNIEYNSYSDIIRCILGREIADSSTIRHFLESKVAAQQQCNRILGDFIPGERCYLCGILIDTWHTGTPHCEHLLPVGQALAIYWLAKDKMRPTDPYDPDRQAFLQFEYKWSCSCCNRVKNDWLFVFGQFADLSGEPFIIDPNAIRDFVEKLCEKIGNEDFFKDPAPGQPRWQGEPSEPRESWMGWPGRKEDSEISANPPLPNGDTGKKLQGTENLQLLCQRKKFQMKQTELCKDDWKKRRIQAIIDTFTPVKNIINHNFLRRGAREEQVGRVDPPQGSVERVRCFVELAKIEMKIKIILALEDEGFVELFCKNNAARRSVVLGLTSAPKGYEQNLSGPKGKKKTLKQRKDERKKKEDEKKKKKREEEKKKREWDAAEAKAKADAERERDAAEAKAKADAERDMRRRAREAREEEFKRKRPEQGQGQGSPGAWFGTDGAAGPPEKQDTSMDVDDSMFMGGTNRRVNALTKTEAGKIEEYLKQEGKEGDPLDLVNKYSDEEEESVAQEEAVATGLEKCISQRGFTKYLLFEIFEEIIEDPPKNNIFILFVIDLLIDDRMNTLFFETFYKEKTTQLGKLINELTDILDNFELPKEV